MRRTAGSVRVLRQLAVLTGCLLLCAATAACGGSTSSSAIPSFHSGTGRVRVLPHPSSGAPAPQFIAYGGHRLLAGLSDVHGSGDGARARLVFALQDVQASVASREYRTDDAVTVGPVHVRIDGIYGSGERDIAVDITLS